MEIGVGVKPNKFDPSLSSIKLVRSGAIAKIILQPSQTDRQMWRLTDMHCNIDLFCDFDYFLMNIIWLLVAFMLIILDHKLKGRLRAYI